MLKLIAVSSLAMLATACSTTPPAVAPAAPQARAGSAPVSAPARAPMATAVKTVMAPAPSPLQVFERSRQGLGEESVYFAFDQSSIAPSQLSVIEANAKLAESYAHDRVMLQGNCDERGGREYNLALGQRRADEVKERLVLLGVPATRIQTVSFGEEKPRASCHNESCWSQNRRADFVHDWQ
jgi:peptidoglycan-associated lipoprotein